jgi:hypothetical protein
MYRLGHGLENRGSIPDRCNIFFFSLQSPDRFWGLPSLLSNGAGGLIPAGEKEGAWSWPLASI